MKSSESNYMTYFGNCRVYCYFGATPQSHLIRDAKFLEFEDDFQN